MQSQIFENSTDFNPRIEEEQHFLEKRLLEQQRQSEEDSRWLAREEVSTFFFKCHKRSFKLKVT